MVDSWILIAGLLAGALLLGATGLALFAGVVVYMLRRRSASRRAGDETVVHAPRPEPSPGVAAPALPAPVTPSKVLRGDAAPPAARRASPLEDTTAKQPTVPPGFAPPPPPPPFQPLAGPPQKGGLPLGFFDDDMTDEAKTELFSREAAKRYAEMLDDEADEGDHTELFSSHDFDDEIGGAVLDDDISMAEKLPGRIVAED